MTSDTAVRVSSTSPPWRLWLRSVPISRRLFGIIGVAAVGFVVYMWFALTSFEAELLDSRQMKTEHLVESAWTVIDGYHQREIAGELTTEEAQAAAIATVKSMRYDETEYFWINDFHPNVVMHPIKPALDGTDVSGLEDPNGKTLFVSFVEQVEAEGEGFVDYLWPPPDNPDGDPIPKISFVKGHEPWGWIVGSGIYIQDVDAAVAAERSSAALNGGAIFALVGLLAWLVSHSITKPLGRLTTRMRGLANGEIDEPIEGANRTDEIGEMAKALQVFRDQAEEVRRLESLRSDEIAERERERAESELDKQRVLAETADAFEQEIGAIAQEVGVFATDLRDAATQLAVNAGQSSVDAEAVLTSTDEAARNVEAVAGAAQDLAASVEQIRARLAMSSSTATDAVTAGEQTRRVVQELDEAAGQISTVVGLISDIADQTNLLALNASIEAARAGEAGAGFAVVASEVKLLAEETNDATNEIRSHVETIQAQTSATVGAIGNIVDTIRGIDESGREISQAIEEQLDTSARIADRARDAASGTDTVVERMQGVSDAASSTGSASEEMLANIDELNQRSQRLQDATAEMVHRITT